MTIGSPSGSGATQNDIADGADESNARWQTYYAGGVYNSQESLIRIKGSGASPIFNPALTYMSSGTSGDFGVISTSGTGAASGPPPRNMLGTILIKVGYASSVEISTLADDHLIGVIESENDSHTTSDTAGFYPTAGDNTSGNVYVDVAGTDNDASITYPTLTDVHAYTVLLDYAGNYLSANTTGFYIDADPRRGDSADATISAVPNAETTNVFGITYSSDGNGHRANINYMEVAKRQ